MESKTPEDIFNDALELPPGARDTFLAEACAGEAELLARLRAMLEMAHRPAIQLEIPSPLSAGDRLGPYSILEELGRGGMGVIYRAEDPRLGRQIAIKVLPDWIAGDKRGFERFQREARMLAALNHPNIATIYSLEHADETHFITMEYVEGKSLAATLAAAKLPLENALNIIFQIAEAVEAAHSRGIIHRDLKPANIMITPDGTTKVLDFGVAKALRAPEAEGPAPLRESVDSTTLSGTPGYMSPEQFRLGRIDHRTDIWSLGCILYECVTGQPLIPSGELSRGAKGEDIYQEINPTFPKHLSRAVVGLIRGCIELDVEKRIDSIQKIRSTLRREIAARRSRRVIWLGAIAAITIAGLMTGKVLLFGNQPELSFVRVDDSSRVVEALDAHGERIWVRTMPHPIQVNTSWMRGLDEQSSCPPLIIKENQRARAVVLATEPDTSFGVLWYLDAGNGRPIWQREAQWRAPQTAGEIVRPVHSWQEQVDLNGEPALAVGIRNNRWYWFAVQIISMQNEMLGTYYHPGHIYLKNQIDLDGDGVSSLILFGSNSSARRVADVVPFETDQHCGTVILLRPPQIDGQAFPYSKLNPARDWPGMDKAREEAYLLIPPISPDLSARVIQVSLSIPSQGPMILEVRVEDGRIYFLDSDLYPQRCWFSSDSEAERLHEADGARILPLIHIQEGELNRVSVPSS